MAIENVKIPETYDTATAAEMLGLSIQTLWLYSSKGGPLTPIRVNGRGSKLRWKASDIARLLGGAE